jgi:predicted RNA-binding Zn ribbon-like protein
MGDINPSARGLSLDSLPVLGGRLCLDFVNTLDPWYGDERIDYIPDYQALSEWAVHIGCSAARDQKIMRGLAEDFPLEAAAVHQRAIDLRADLHALLRRDRAAGNSRALLGLNRELRRSGRHLTIVRSGPAYELTFAFEEELDAMLWPIARSAAELLSSPRDLARVRECDGVDCGWIFIDTSKSGRRRWCSMDICGNRAKVERHRAARIKRIRPGTD